VSDTAEGKDAARKLQGQYSYEKHMSHDADHAGVMPELLIDAQAVAGTVDECLDRVREICETRVDQVAIIPFGRSVDDRPRVMRAFAEEVFRPVLDERVARAGPLQPSS
jgi:hypothetical protein